MSDSTRTKIAFGGLALSTALAVAMAQEPLRPVTSPEASSTTGAVGEVPRDGSSGTARGGSGVLEPLRPGDAGDAGSLGLELEDAIAESLSILDLDAREAAFDRWAARASREPAVRAALEAIAADASDVDLAFAARLALRESRRSDARWGAPDAVWPKSGGPNAGGPGARSAAPFGRGGFGADPFAEMRREMERVFGGDPLFGGASPFPGALGGDPLMGRDPFQRFEPFWRGGVGGGRGLQERIDRMHAEIEEMLGRAGGFPPMDGGAVGGGSMDWRTSGMSVEMTPDGVKVTITEQGSEGQETRTYEAPSIEELLEAHPELEGRIR